MRDGQLDCRKRVVGVLLVLALRALHRAFELALHQVDNYRLISLQVQLPERIRFLLVCAFQVGHLDVLLLLDSVHVFVQLVEQLGEELLRVMLIVAYEHLVVLREDFLELAGVHVPRMARLVPYLVEQLRELTDDFAVGPQRVLAVDLVSEAHREQVLPKALQVGQALERTIHVARVTQVVEADDTIRGVQLHL